MKEYTIVDAYSGGRKAYNEESTIFQEKCIINRVLRMLEESFQVVVNEEEIIGLTPMKLQLWFNGFIEGRKPNTLKSYVMALNPFLRWAYEAKVVQLDLSRIIRKVRVPKTSMLPPDERPLEKYLTHEQFEELMKCDGGRNKVRNRAMFALIAYSGLRAEELCSLTYGQMQRFRSGELRELVIRRKGGEYVPVVIGEKYWPYYDEYISIRNGSTADNAPLFLTSHGTPCSPHSLYESIRTIQDRLGQARGPHVLRHTFVSEVEKTGGAGIARDCANHKSLVITNRYDHTTIEQRQAAVDSLNW